MSVKTRVCVLFFANDGYGALTEHPRAVAPTAGLPQPEVRARRRLGLDEAAQRREVLSVELAPARTLGVESPWSQFVSGCQRL
jgi:hypothetical protein